MLFIRSSLYLILFCATLLPVPYVLAQEGIGKPLTLPAKRVICPNGQVQYTPCLPAQLRPAPVKSQAGKSGTVTQNLNRDAQVFNKNFRPIGSGQGLWEGFVSGRGLLSLTLMIYNNGQLKETRYIGQVQQSLREKPTKFRFKSALPLITNWTWDVAVSRARS